MDETTATAMDKRNGEIPQLLVEELPKHYGADVEARIHTGFDVAQKRPVTLRANTLVATRDEVALALNQAGLSWHEVPWYEDAFVLPDASERSVWELPIYQDGKIYLQSLSSMIPPLVLAPRPKADVLDMCAAPGGKTSQMAALCSKAHITACEMSVPRAEKLEHNLNKLSIHNVNVMRCDARRLDKFFSFDQILLDAPCTGTGTVRAGDGRACKHVTSALLTKVMKSQRALLDRALDVLKPGGELVYSTCSILPQENEEQLTAALKRHRDCTVIPLTLDNLEAADTGDDIDPAVRRALAPDSLRAIVQAAADGSIPTLPNSLEGTLTVCPTRDYEGFFVAAVVKREG